MQTDTWSSLKNLRDHCAFIISLPDVRPGCGLKYFVLTVPSSPAIHTAEGYRDAMLSVLQEWGLKDKLAGITTDTTNVNPAAYYQVADRWMGCFCHVMHLAVLDVLRIVELKDVISCVRALVKMVRSSTLFMMSSL